MGTTKDSCMSIALNHWKCNRDALNIIIFLPKVLHSQGTWKLAKCSDCVQNGYGGDSEIVTIIIIIKYIFVNTTVLTA